jgi:hypothetical protein
MLGQSLYFFFFSVSMQASAFSGFSITGFSLIVESSAAFASKL